MKLSKCIAQKIVLEMMKVIPYNINVMDENGVIIGSGDSTRIGNIHEGSLKAINNRCINEVYENNEIMKPGVNTPIIIEDKIIGVIGITGHPDEVGKFSKLVCATAILLIEQSKIDEEIHNKKLNKERFFHELVHRKKEYDNEFYEQAQNYRINISNGIKVIIVDADPTLTGLKLLYERYHHYIYDKNKVAFFISSSQEYNMFIKKLKKIECINKISIGNKDDIAAYSLENAKLVLEIGLKIKPSSLIYDYDEFRLFIKLSHEDKQYFVSLISNLDLSGNKLELIETMQTYVEENGDINSIASKLNIHRNTLNYRLERINQLTGKNPKNLLELFELVCGLIWR